MAKIKINGDSSGYVEIAAPNAANNNTLELGPGTKILTDKNTHISNIGIGTANPRYPLEVNSGNLLVSGSAAGNLILEDRSVGDSSRPFALLASNNGNFTITNANRNASGTTTSSVERLRITSDGKLTITTATNSASAAASGDNLVIKDSDGCGLSILSGNGNSQNIYLGSVSDNDGVRLEGFYNSGSPYFNIYTGGTHRLRIDSNGNMGLGTNSPNNYSNYTTLTLNGTNGGELDFESGGTLLADTFANSGGYYFTTRTAIPIKFHTTNSGGTHAERVQITAQGLLGINHASAAQIGKVLTIRPANDDGIRFIRPGETASDPNKHLELTTTTSGSNYPSGEAYTVKYKTFNCDQIFETYEGGGTGGHIAFKTAPQGGTPSDRFVIDEAGTIFTNAATIDNTSSHGVIVAHAPASNADTGYKSIEIGNSNGNNSSRGSTICAQPKSNSHPPYTLIGSWDDGSNTDVYYGGGFGSNMRPATRHRFYTNSSYPTANGSGTLNMVLDGNGHLTVPNQPAFSAIGFPAHRYMNTWHNVDLDDWNYLEQNGSHFNNSNGRFTAPVAGKYFFIYTSMYHNPSSNDFHNYIIKNGSTVTQSNNISGGGSSEGHQWNDCTTQAVVNMAANDYVTARSTGSSSSTCYLYGSGVTSKYSSFCGFLIG